MGLLYGRAGRLTAQNGGFRPGQCAAGHAAAELNAKCGVADTQITFFGARPASTRPSADPATRAAHPNPGPVEWTPVEWTGPGCYVRMPTGCPAGSLLGVYAAPRGESALTWVRLLYMDSLPGAAWRGAAMPPPGVAGDDARQRALDRDVQVDALACDAYVTMTQPGGCAATCPKSFLEAYRQSASAPLSAHQLHLAHLLPGPEREAKDRYEQKCGAGGAGGASGASGGCHSSQDCKGGAYCDGNGYCVSRPADVPYNRTCDPAPDGTGCACWDRTPEPGDPAPSRMWSCTAACQQVSWAVGTCHY